MPFDPSFHWRRFSYTGRKLSISRTRKCSSTRFSCRGTVKTANQFGSSGFMQPVSEHAMESFIDFLCALEWTKLRFSHLDKTFPQGETVKNCKDCEARYFTLERFNHAIQFLLENSSDVCQTAQSAPNGDTPSSHLGMQAGCITESLD